MTEVGKNMKIPKYLQFPLMVFIAIVMASIYGALHDQVSYTVSQEYFTLFKYIQFQVDTLSVPARVKAGIIGVLATWYMGLPIGLFLGVTGLKAARQEYFGLCIRTFGVVILVAGLTGIIGLAYGWFFASHDPGDYHGWFIPDGLKHTRNFLSVGYMHNFSYLGGATGLAAGAIWQYFALKGIKKQ